MGESDRGVRLGRPRVRSVEQRDERILEMLRERPMTSREIRNKLKLHYTLVYLSLCRLRNEGWVYQTEQGVGMGKLWAAVEEDADSDA